MNVMESLPTRAEFIRGQLVAWYRARGIEVCIANPHGLPGVTVWTCLKGRTDLWVTARGHVFGGVADAFDWRAVPTDTGVMPGPHRPRYEDVREVASYRGSWTEGQGAVIDPWEA